MKTTELNTNKYEVRCPYCLRTFLLQTINAGMNASEFLYCDKCGTACSLSFYTVPPNPLQELFDGGGWKVFEKPEVQAQVEQLVDSCGCGGHFKFNAIPRCFLCRRELEPKSFQKELRRAGYKSWNRKWRTLTCFVIGGQYYRDHWKPEALAASAIDPGKVLKT